MGSSNTWGNFCDSQPLKLWTMLALDNNITDFGSISLSGNVLTHSGLVMSYGDIDLDE